MRRAQLDQIRQDLDALAEQLAAELARPETVGDPELVGVGEVALMADVAPKLVSTWRQRGRMPEPYVVLQAGPIWLKADIEHWLERRAA